MSNEKSSRKYMRIIMAGGGTGGHLFPGISLAKQIKRENEKALISFVGTSHGLDLEVVPRAGYAIDVLSAGRGNPLSKKRPLDAIRFVFSIFQSIKLFRKYKPDVLVALGGFAAAAPGIAAYLLDVPVVILEQNSVPGQVNLHLSRFAKKIYLQFRCARKFFTKTTANFFDFGSPLREEMRGLANEDIVSGDALLVMGGSQGARRLNEIVLKSIAEISKQTNCKVIHIAGAANEDEITQAYKELGIEATVHGFFGGMEKCYRQAKLAISRSGAGSIAELAAAGVPSVLVPLPTSKDNHQFLNAKWVEERGGALVLEQDLLTPEILAKQVMRLWNDDKAREIMAECVRRTARPEAAKEIAENIFELIESRNAKS